MAAYDELQKQLIKDLLIESSEGLDRFDREMLALEKGQGTPDTANIIFRVIHTIKGTAGCLGLSKIESVAHVGENLLSLLRDGKLTVTQPLIGTLLAYADALRQMLRCLETQGNEGDADHSTLLAQLQALAEGKATAAPAVTDVKTGSETPAQNWGLFDDEPAVAPATTVQAVHETSPADSVVTNTHSATSVPTVAVHATAPSAADSAIRVNVEQLDKLMNLVGELVLARNQIIQHSSATQEAGLIGASQRLNIITTELQESVMKTRMQPIGNVWAKFPRIVRDVAFELGKKVKLVMEGDKTELDRTIIEAIKDPLTHIVRNAIDHGIEQPSVRVKEGKPEEGLIVLRAFHEGGQVNIEIMDDGRGINVSKVRQKAVEKGIVNSEQAGRLSDREVFNLIFLPGFSTADKVTNVSGRGVGMDVVKTNIEKIGGSVDILSEVGNGSTIKIKIPLTLAIIPALIVSSGGERFAIPQVSLLELVRLEGETAKKGIEMLYGTAVYRLRGQLLPLCYLNKQLEIGEGRDTGSASVVNIVVVQADGRQFGMIVDEINDTEEIVVKPLGKQLRGLTCFAGATIMGDGRVALILDILGLAQRANMVNEVRDRALLDKTASDTRSTNRQTLLVFDASKGSRMAIPLSMVSRLEEFPRSAVERSGLQEVVQYRGKILPLIRVADHVSGIQNTIQSQDPMQVVVYSEQNRSVGLVVGRINDIVEEAITVKRDAKAGGILGSVVIQDKVTDLLDVSAVIRAADPSFFNQEVEQTVN